VRKILPIIFEVMTGGVKNALFLGRVPFRNVEKIYGMTQNSFHTDFLFTCKSSGKEKVLNLLHHDIKLSIFKTG